MPPVVMHRWGGYLPKVYTARAGEPYLSRVTWVPPPTNMQQPRTREPACAYINRELALPGPILALFWPFLVQNGHFRGALPPQAIKCSFLWDGINLHHTTRVPMGPCGFCYLSLGWMFMGKKKIFSRSARLRRLKKI